LFFPWDRAFFPGGATITTVYGWDSLLGITCGISAFALLLAAHASFMVRRVSPLLVAYLAVGLAFFTAVRLIDEAVLRKGFDLAWASYVGIVAAGIALSAALIAGRLRRRIA
jgi:di/tricarboxylate transporter